MSRLPNPGKAIMQAVMDVDEDTSDGDETSTQHANLVAPASLTLAPESARTGERWTKTLYIEDFPDYARPRMLEELFSRTSVNVDVSIHVDPQETTDAISSLEDAMRDLEAAAAGKEDRGDVTARDTMRRLQEHEEVYDQLTVHSEEAFDVGVYITIRGDSEDEVRDVADRITTTLATNQLSTKPADYAQQDGLISVSPIGADRLNRTSTMLGGAVGAMYPFSATTVIEEEGDLMGYHALTGSPLIVDRFGRPNGYNLLMLGNIGAGKSFDTKLNLLRTLAKDKDTIVIMIDPMGEFDTLTDTLNGDRIAVNGTKSLNPLEIRETPEHVREKIEERDHDPFRQARMAAMDFFDSYFAMHSNEGLQADRRAVLALAVDVAYARRGITSDPTTHSRESPTISDVIDILGEISQEPLPFILSAEADIDLGSSDLSDVTITNSSNEASVLG